MKAKTYLTNIQKKYELTHVEMAEKLGVERMTWYRIRNGKQGVNEKVKLNAIQSFPELEPIFLPRNVHKSNTVGNKGVIQ